jgi:glycerophosphoryl diester phosphodiesterase
MFAHRGASAHARENTIEAFELGLKLGATGLESDVWLTRDRVPVLDHGGTIRRGLRRRPIATMGRGELPAHIPSLVEVLDAVGTDFQLSLDMKDPEAAPIVVDQLERRAPELVARTWLCSPDLERLTAWRERSADVRLVNSTRLDRLPDGPERRAARLAALRIDAVNLHRTAWTGGLVVLFHRFEILAFGWDLQFDHQLVAGIRMGLDAVYSDDVEVMESVHAAEIGR